MSTLDLSGLHGRVRATCPLIQNITNTVVQQFSANVLLAIGAAPAMLDHEADAGQFAGLADGLLVNFGTATSHQFLAADAAIRVMRQQHKPWVLDPVSVGVASYRTTRILQAMACGPSAIRGNASEIAALAGEGAGGRGVDSTDEVDAVLPAAVSLAGSTGSVVAVSGACDAIVEVHDQTVRVARVFGGHPLMTKVIGTGCSLGSVTAAYLAAARSGDAAHRVADFDAVVAAHAHFALAGQAAGAVSRGSGSFAVGFLDALQTLSSSDMAQARVQVEVRELPDVCGL